MTKLHELLAAEGNLKTQANTVRTQLADTFEKKQHLFEEARTVFTPNTENSQQQVEAQSDIQTTVAKELNWVKGHLSKAWDASYQIAESNTMARADITLDDGTKLLEAVPSTALLELESKLTDFRGLLNSIPTLDPAKGYSLDAQREGGIYKAREVLKTRTKKQNTPLVLYPHSDKHPAQTQLIVEDVPVGTIREQSWSAKMTPADKSNLLDRCDHLIRAVKRARSRANDQQVDTNKKIGEKLLAFVVGK